MTSRTGRQFALLSILCLSHIAFAGVVGIGTPGSCTEPALAAAIPAGGVITFNCGAGPQTIAITYMLGVGQNNPPVVIDGKDQITLDGSGITTGMIGIFGSAESLPDVTLKHLTVAHGDISTGLNAGGAIQNFGRLTLDNVTLRDNHSSGAGAIFQEPCNGCLTPVFFATQCLFQNNTTGGGAISIQGGIASIEDSTFSGNSARGGGAIEVYGNASFTVDISIDRCTFNGNHATSGGGGAIIVEVLNPGSAVRIVNDTFTNNTVAGSGGQGSAIYVGAAPVTITNCTIAGNTAGPAGGAVYFGANATAMANTIVASNSGGNCSGGTFSGGHNLQFGDATCSGATVADPHLSPLANNGGPTQTMALAAGSPAIDTADTTVAPAIDQRGTARTDGDHDGIVIADIGAFEAPGGTGTPPPPRRHTVRH